MIEKDGEPVVLASLDAAAERTVGIHFMYDVKQCEPSGWSSPSLNLASGHFGLGHGSDAHAPDEYFVSESEVPGIVGWDGAMMSCVKHP